MLSLVLAACGKTSDSPTVNQGRTAEWKANYTPAECKALADPKAVVDRCLGGNLASAKDIDDLQCWPFSKPRRLQGIWLIGLEASQFYPRARNLEEVENHESQIWLETDILESRADLLAAAQGAGTRVYAVDLEGREALCDGMFGHFGMYPKQVIVEQFHSMRLLTGPGS